MGDPRTPSGNRFCSTTSRSRWLASLPRNSSARTPTQPGKGHERDTLLNGLFAAFGPQLQNLGRARDFGLLHRLDRQTSGLLIVGLRPRSYDALRGQFEKRAIKKFYWALASRTPKKPSGVIRRPILEEADEKKTARISSAGKPSVTAYRGLRPEKFHFEFVIAAAPTCSNESAHRPVRSSAHSTD